MAQIVEAEPWQTGVEHGRREAFRDDGWLQWVAGPAARPPARSSSLRRGQQREHEVNQVSDQLGPGRQACRVLPDLMAAQHTDGDLGQSDRARAVLAPRSPVLIASGYQRPCSRLSCRSTRISLRSHATCDQLRPSSSDSCLAVQRASIQSAPHLVVGRDSYAVLARAADPAVDGRDLESVPEAPHDAAVIARAARLAGSAHFNGPRNRGGEAGGPAETRSRRFAGSSFASWAGVTGGSTY